MPSLSYNEVRQYVREIREDRRERVREIALNEEYYRGTQERHYDQYTRGPYGRPIRYRVRPDRTDEVRYSSHLMKATIERITAAVGMTPVRYYGIPANRMLDARASAQFTTLFLQWLRQGDFPKPMLDVRKDVAFLAQIHGTVFVKAGFDRWGGDPLNVPEEVANELLPSMKNRVVYTGQSWGDVVRWEQLYFPRWTMRLEDAPAVVEERWVTAGEILRRFPRSRTVREIIRKRGMDSTTLDSFYHQGEVPNGRNLQFLKHNYRLWEVWVPNGQAWGAKASHAGAGTNSKTIREFPKGKLQYFLDDQPIFESDNPYGSMGINLPYTAASHSDDPVQGALEGIALGSLLRGQVPYIELLINKLLESVAHYANPPLLSPGGIKRKAWNERIPGGMVEYNRHIGKPEFLQMPPTNPAAFSLVNELIAMLMEDSGVREASRGGVPKRLESGKALAIALEQDLSRMNNFHHSVDEALRQHLWKRVQMEAALSIGPRSLPVFSQNQLIEVGEWAGSAMQGTNGVFRASSPTINYSPEVSEAKIKENLALGIISMEEAIDQLALPPPEGQFYGTRTEEQSVARVENRMMAAGQNPETLSVYNHSVHSTVHTQYLIQKRWEMSEDQIRVLVAHIEDHENRQMLAMVGQQRLLQSAMQEQGFNMSQGG